jgi:hypothetical protein
MPASPSWRIAKTSLSILATQPHMWMNNGARIREHLGPSYFFCEGFAGTDNFVHDARATLSRKPDSLHLCGALPFF